MESLCSTATMHLNGVVNSPQVVVCRKNRGLIPQRKKSANNRRSMTAFSATVGQRNSCEYTLEARSEVLSRLSRLLLSISIIFHFCRRQVFLVEETYPSVSSQRPFIPTAESILKLNNIRVFCADSTSSNINNATVIDSPLHAPFIRTSLLSIASAGVIIMPLAAHAAETAPEGFFEFLFQYVESLGPLGPVAFIVAVSMCECIPLFPTQPLSLASGLLFGTQKGAVYMLIGTSMAAFIAFQIARGVGRPFAERIIRHEMAAMDTGDDADDSNSNGSSSNSKNSAVQMKLKEIEAVIEAGSVWQQGFAIFLLRMTPFIPFSACNYILGLSPLPLAPYLTGTIISMGFWSVTYASVGGASRMLLQHGADPDTLMASVIERAGNLSGEVGSVAAVAGGVAAVVLCIVELKRRSAANA